MFNLSLSTGLVPDELKIAKLIPEFKKDDLYNFDNYRPTFISKLLEKYVYNRLYCFNTKILSGLPIWL